MADEYLYGSDVVDYPALDFSPGGGYYGSDLLDLYVAPTDYGDQSPGGGYYGSDLVTGQTITDQTARVPGFWENLFGGNISGATGQAGEGLGKLTSSAIKTLFQDDKGNLDMRKLATLGGGLAGLLGSKDGLSGLFGGSSGQQPSGYQGGIPQLQAVRQQVQAPASSRPGEAGRRYFTDVQYAPKGSAPAALAEGGLAELAKGRYLGGATDGMADELPANIDGEEPAKLSHGEFVVSADVVSHLGNGNSDAGAKRLYEMMDRIRKARTGTTKQGRKINPNKFLPS